jgi:hypothetical protein
VSATLQGPPVPGYELLSAREAMRRLVGLTLEQLERLHSYEDLHQRRSSVLRAIRRAIARLR